MVGLKAEEIVASRQGNGNTPKVTAALAFAKAVLSTKGQIREDELTAVRAAGFSDGEIAEIIAHVALNVFNIAAGVNIDFPKVSHTEVAA
jgi:alkylhydroperoxidase family enzyme